MTQSQTGNPTKVAGDKVDSAYVNALNDTINDNATDAEPKLFDDPSGSLADPTTPHFAERTVTVDAGVQTAVHVQHIADFLNTQIGVALLADVINTGSATGGGGHLPALIGRCEDTLSGASTLPMWGVEGKIIQKGEFNGHFPLFLIYQRNVDTPLGGNIVSLICGFAELTEADGTTPDATGTVIHLDCTVIGTGGSEFFAVKGSNVHKIETGGNIKSTQSSVISTGVASEVKAQAIEAGRSVSLNHDDTKGSIKQSDINQDLEISSGRFLIYEQGSGFVARNNGANLGIDGFRWKVASTETNMKHQTTPADPDAGSVVLYSKSDDKLYFKDSGGTEHEIATV